MEKADKIILVTGATGRQGGATARHLLANGWQVRALVRDPNKLEAQAIQQAGAELVRGDFEDRASLESAMRGVYGAFSVQAAFAEQEITQGKTIADVAKAAGVQHFVYTSVQSAEDLARVGGDANKWKIEQYIGSLSLPATILRPPFFMDTLIAPRTDVPHDVSTGTFTIAINPDAPLGLIAAEDIGAFAALAFEHPDTYLGKTLDIAGDALTPLQIADTLSRVTGQPTQYAQFPVEQVRQNNPQIGAAIDYLNEMGYTVDVSALRNLYPNLMDFETWLKHEGTSKLETTRMSRQTS